MSVRFLFALAVGLALCAGPVLAADPAPAKKPDPTAELLAKLGKPVDFQKNGNISLHEFASFIQEKFGVSIVINEHVVRVHGEGDPKNLKVRCGEVKGLPLGVSLRQILDQLDATFLVRRTYIEIVTFGFAAHETKNVEDGRNRMKEPLVSTIFKEKPLNEAVAELAEEFDLNVVVSPQSADARSGFVTARLLNVPADKALELLAIQCDLRVVRKGNAFLITSRDHANEMFGERLEKARQMIELQKFREAPLPKPEPAPPPEPKPEPKPEK